MTLKETVGPIPGLRTVGPCKMRREASAQPWSALPLIPPLSSLPELPEQQPPPRWPRPGRPPWASRWRPAWAASWPPTPSVERPSAGMLACRSPRGTRPAGRWAPSGAHSTLPWGRWAWALASPLCLPPRSSRRGPRPEAELLQGLTVQRPSGSWRLPSEGREGCGACWLHCRPFPSGPLGGAGRVAQPRTGILAVFTTPG